MTELPHHLKDWSREEEKACKEAIQRVRELHTEIDGPADDRTCSACAVDEYDYPEYPCETIKALEGV